MKYFSFAFMLLSSFVNAVESISKKMEFEKCLKQIRQTASQLGVAPINIVETESMRMVRFNASDGSVLITCSKLDQKMVITRSSK